MKGGHHSYWITFVQSSFKTLPAMSFFEWVKFIDSKYPVKMFDEIGFQIMNKPNK